MENKFIFFDLPDSGVVEAYRAVLSQYENFSFIECDCRKIIMGKVNKKTKEVEKVDVIVSPANSIGLMDGGIDKYYTSKQMFPGIQKVVQATIRQYGIKSGDHYVLPVGSAILLPTQHKLCTQMICAPTMPVPCDISDTQNVYKCFMGILQCMSQYKNLTIAIPGLGTHCGKMSPVVSARQIDAAIKDFLNDVEVENVRRQKKGEFVVNLVVI